MRISLLSLRCSYFRAMRSLTPLKLSSCGLHGRTATSESFTVTASASAKTAIIPCLSRARVKATSRLELGLLARTKLQTSKVSLVRKLMTTSIFGTLSATLILSQTRQRTLELKSSHSLENQMFTSTHYIPQTIIIILWQPSTQQSHSGTKRWCLNQTLVLNTTRLQVLIISVFMVEPPQTTRFRPKTRIISRSLKLVQQKVATLSMINSGITTTRIVF